MSASSRPPGTTSVVVAVASPELAVDLGRIVREVLDARACRRAGCAGSIVTTQRVAAAARAFEREHRRGRRLARRRRVPQQITTLPVGDELLDRIVTVARSRASSASASTSSCGRVMSGVKTNGSSICGSGSRSRESFDLLVLQRVPFVAERGRVREVVGLAVATRSAGTRRRREDRGGIAVTPAGSGAKHPLTTTGPSATPARSSIANAVSMTSLTGVSSGSVTSITWQRAGSEIRLDDVLGLLADRADAHRVEQPARREEERDRVAGRGRVDDHEVGRRATPRSTSPCRARGCPSCPGTAVATTSSAPDAASRFEMRFIPCDDEVVDERGVGREEAGADAGVEIDLVVAERPGRRTSRGSPDLPSTSTMSTEQPGARGGHRERGRDRRLPDATLAGDDDDVGGGAEIGDLHRPASYEACARQSSGGRRLRRSTSVRPPQMPCGSRTRNAKLEARLLHGALRADLFRLRFARARASRRSGRAGGKNSVDSGPRHAALRRQVSWTIPSATPYSIPRGTMKARNVSPCVRTHKRAGQCRLR